MIGLRAFGNCTSLESIHVNMFNKFFRSRDRHLYTKDMKKLIAYANKCKEISYIIPKSVTVIGDTSFYSCSSLESIILPENIMCLEDFAFDQCTNLKQIQYNGTVKMWKSIKIGQHALRKVSANAVNCLDGIAEI